MHRFLPAQTLNWVCHHLHIDKSKTVNTDRLQSSLVHMKEKWTLMRDIKHGYEKDEMERRMVDTTTQLVNQGCTKMRTFVDVDRIVGLTPLHCAMNVKGYWKSKGVDLQVGTQLLEGLETADDISLFHEVAPIVDFIGCLPSRDSDPRQHLDLVFDVAQALDKDVEAHLDQCNIPTETETELFCDMVEKYGRQGRSRAIHCVSLACHPIEYQHTIAKRLNELDIGVIVCPSAAISMRQHNEYSAPIHNSIAPVKVLMDEGVNIGLGVDNVEDIFMPFCDGSLPFELRLLAEAERMYDPEVLRGIACNEMGFDNES